MPMRFSRLLAAMLFVAGAAFFCSAAFAANLDEACGGKEAVTCNSALWCHKTGGQCEAADAPGKCEKAPTFCMRVSRPVCGCNGKTYANDCERQRVKVQLDHAGACKKEEPPRPATPAKKKGKG
jgi:hypothetical protein